LSQFSRRYGGNADLDELSRYHRLHDHLAWQRPQGALILMNFVPARFGHRLLVAGGMAIVDYANLMMLGYSPAPD
jgi:hypothetical protein